MKTKEELCALKTEVENLSKKLAELTEEELAQVTGGLGWIGMSKEGNTSFSTDFSIPDGGDSSFDINIYKNTERHDFTMK